MGSPAPSGDVEASPLRQLCGPSAFARLPNALAAVTRLDEIAGVNGSDGAPHRAMLVILPREALDHAMSYELDVAVRVAADVGVVGIVLVGRSSAPPTVRQLADRTGIRVFGCDPDTSIVSLVRVLDSLIDEQHRSSLESVRQLVHRLNAAPSESGADDLVHLVQQAMRQQISLQWWVGEQTAGTPIVVAGHRIGALIHRDPDDAAAELVLAPLASAVGRAQDAKFAEAERRGDAVALLLQGDTPAARAAEVRARGLGVSLDARHSVICYSLQSGDGSPKKSTPQDRRHHMLVALLTLQTQEGVDPQEWIITRVQGDLALVRSESEEPGPSDDLPEPRSTTAAVARLVLANLTSQVPGIRFFAGMSASANGANGLRQLAIEAQASSRIARSRTMHDVVQFSASDMKQTLTELGNSPVARRSLAEAIQPLLAAPARSTRVLIETLAAYLDCGGSRTRAAAELHLHPNAVKYRLDKVLPLIGGGLDERDSRLLIHLGCRLWLLEHSDEARPQSASQ